MVANCLMQTNDIENVAGTWQRSVAAQCGSIIIISGHCQAVAERVAESAARSLKVPQITHANWLCCCDRLQRYFDAVFRLQSSVYCLPTPRHSPSVVSPLALTHDLHMHISQ